MRIKFADIVQNVCGQNKKSGSFIRSIISLLLIVAAIILWLMGPQAVDWVKTQIHPIPIQHIQAKPAQATPLLSIDAPVRKYPQRDFYPTILSATKQVVIIDSNGKILSIQQGMRTPSGWLLTSTSPEQATFLDPKSRRVTIRYNEQHGKWMTIK